ncbi:MAG: hypothetical protein JNK87_21055 [Bryobacterales bacterium]|nr:hypothetical protein [Bryobacterales bacterium]
MNEYSGDNEAAVAGDISHDLDLATVFESQGAEGEMEAMAVHGVLVANGIDAVLMGSSSLPNLPFIVKVPLETQAEAQRLLAEAQAAGPAAADEAEQAGEAEPGATAPL